MTRKVPNKHDLPEEPTCWVDRNGDRQWRRGGVIHRLDGPAIEYGDGTYKAWYVNGVPHRVGLPAVESINGVTAWYHHGLRHRVDGPAIIYSSGVAAWYSHDLLHRVDGPAYEDPQGPYKRWYLRGREFSQDLFTILNTAAKNSGRSIDTVLRLYDELDVPEDTLGRLLMHLLGTSKTR